LLPPRRPPSKACSDPPAPPPCHPASPAASRACRPGPPQVRRGAAGSALVGQRPLGPRDLLPYPCGDPRRLRPRGLPPPPQLHLHENDDRFNYHRYSSDDDRFNYHRYSSDGKTCQHPRSPCRPPRRGRGRVLGGRAEEGAACKATRFCALPAAASIACHRARLRNLTGATFSISPWPRCSRRCSAPTRARPPGSRSACTLGRKT